MEKSIEKKVMLPHFLADTCWFAMTRLSDEQFLRLVKFRQNQGFTAIQIVVGIPPEVGIENENAKSIYGSAYDMKGRINYDYLEFVQQRVKVMNNYGLTAIIYGAWGNQIEWIGYKNMLNWWKSLIKVLDELDVIYCLTGEIDIWCDPILSKALLPNKTTGSFEIGNSKMKKMLKRVYSIIFSNTKLLNSRLVKWSKVLKEIVKLTNKPIMVHTLPTSSGFSVVRNIDWVSANTFQTGHSKDSEINIWKNIYESKKQFPDKPAINLEPWYEGIFNDFYEEEQLKAFWLSVTSGAHSICYGAHGIWNVGNENFLSQWGNQTFEDALKLNTPNILGKTYKMLLELGVFNWNEVSKNVVEDELVSISRISKKGKKITYIPSIEKCKNISKGRFLDIKLVEFTSELPKNGSVVVFS